MHLGAVAGGDGFGERGEFGGVGGEGVQGDAVALLGGDQAVQLGLGDGDVVFCYGELPGLGVVPRWGAGGGFYDGADGLGVGHGGILFLGLLLWGL